MNDITNESEDNDIEVARANALISSDNLDEIRAGMKIIESRASSGDCYSIYTMAKWHRTGFGGYDVNPKREDELIEIAVNALVPDAIFDLGAKSDGRELSQRQTALGYYIASAIMGDIDAMEAIVNMLRDTDTIGDGVKAANLLDSYIKNVVKPKKG